MAAKAAVRARSVTMAASAASATLLALILMSTASAAARVSRSRAVVGEDGGYSGVTVRISDDVPEEDCADIIQNLKVGNHPPLRQIRKRSSLNPNSLVLEKLQTTHTALSIVTVQPMISCRERGRSE